VPLVIPDVLESPLPAAAAWGDAATLVPWVLYQRTGDVGLLERQLPSMRAWVDYIAGLAGADRLWTGGFQLGDWLDPTAPHDAPFEAQADPDVVATAYLARSAEVVGLAAAVTRDADAAEKYARLAGEVRDAFAREFVTPPVGSSATPRRCIPWHSHGPCCPPPTSGTTPGTAWPTWYGRPASGSAPGSSAPR
jgi:alpha-L-rhamnosidase